MGGGYQRALMRESDNTERKAIMPYVTMNENDMSTPLPARRAGVVDTNHFAPGSAIIKNLGRDFDENTKHMTLPQRGGSLLQTLY